MTNLDVIEHFKWISPTVAADQDGDDLIKEGEAVDESALCDRTSVPASLIPNNGKKMRSL